MKFDAFLKSVNNLVREWATDEPKPGAVPRDALRAIWEQLRDDTAFELAQQQRKKDEEPPSPYL